MIQYTWKHNPQECPTCFQLIEDIHNEMNRIHKLTVSNNDSYVIDLRAEGAPSERNDSISSTKKILSEILFLADIYYMLQSSAFNNYRYQKCRVSLFIEFCD